LQPVSVSIALADKNERVAIMRQIDSFLPIIKDNEKSFWLKFRQQLERLNEKIRVFNGFDSYDPTSWRAQCPPTLKFIITTALKLISLEKSQIKIYHFFTTSISKSNIKRRKTTNRNCSKIEQSRTRTRNLQLRLSKPPLIRKKSNCLKMPSRQKTWLLFFLRYADQDLLFIY
jgi:hypothetical protein